VLELVIEPSLPLKTRKQVAALLCEALETRAIEKGEDMIQLSIPSTDPALCDVLREQDYGEEVGEFLNMTVVDPVALIRQILDHRSPECESNGNKTFLLEFANGYYRFNPFPLVRVVFGNRVSVEPITTREPADCHINTDLSVFTELVFNRLSFRSAVEAGSLRVDPITQLDEAESLINLVTLRTPWYSPYADCR
jgi:hypothetical protein